jgi:uncharacterized protein YggE
MMLLPVALLVSDLTAMSQTPKPALPEPDVVVTAGEAVIKQAPDQAFVTLVSEARAKVPAEAQKSTATAMTNVQQKLKGAGIAGDAIRTVHFDLQPEFDFVQGKQVLRGYVSRNSIEVRIDAIERVGEIVDLAVQAGATSIGSLRFDVKKREAFAREALTMAVKDARARAEAAAAGAGRAIDRIVRIEDNSASEPPTPRPCRFNPGRSRSGRA